ncbi:MAG: hypothetical protein EOO13_11545 [Chitinophagaceae bacterium]|nr:MAG: hypothetical protein EOO13_11545 [Chitinophagaceae bacterium]
MEQAGETIMDIVLAETNIEVLQKRSFFPEFCAFINRLIVEQFNELITLLYRLDINETKLKDLLQQHASEDAANIIANLIVERQEQKLRSRDLFKSFDNIPEEEKW